MSNISKRDLRFRRAQEGVEMDPLMDVHVSGEAYDGYLVIDSLVDNTSSGGVRVAPDLRFDEVKELAREMTLKYAFFDLPRGGAKAGVRLEDGIPTNERLALLEDFGRHLSPIIRNGIYNPGMDMNCGPEELKAIYRGAGIELGRPTDTSYFTAVSMANAIAAYARELHLPRNAPLTLAIEGFGSVGYHLAKRLPADQYQIVSVSTLAGAIRNPNGFAVNELTSLKEKFGDGFVTQVTGERIDRERLLTDSVDILLPAARTRSITAGLALRIQARAVIPVSNAPYEQAAIRVLFERNIVCLPGYVTNAGGVLGSSLFDSGISMTVIERFFEDHYRPVVGRLLRASRELGVSPCTLAESVAMRRAEARCVKSKWPSSYRRQWKRLLPKWTKGRIALRRCRSALEALEAEIAAQSAR